MINLRQLLTKICESIYSLLNWKDSTTSIINTASEKGTRRASAVTSITRAGNYTNLTYFTLPPGVWILFGRVYIPSNTTGLRGLYIGKNSATTNVASSFERAVQTTVTRLTVSCTMALSENTTIYLVCYCNSSGVTTFTNAGLYAIKLGPYRENLQTTY